MRRNELIKEKESKSIDETTEKSKGEHSSELLLGELFQEIFNTVEESLTNAIKAKKPLLVIAGEGHADKGCFLQEMMLLHVLNDLNIKNIAVECAASELNPTLKDLRLMKLFDTLSIFKWYKPYWLDGNQRCPNMAYNLIYAKNNLGMTLIATDSEKKMTASRFNGYQLKERDEAFISSCNEIKEHAALFIGVGHIKGVSQSDTLKASHYLCTLNLTKAIRERSHMNADLNESLNFADSSDQMVRFKIPEECNIHDLSRESIQDLVEKIRKQFKTRLQRSNDEAVSSFFGSARDSVYSKVSTLFGYGSESETASNAEKTSEDKRLG